MLRNYLNSKTIATSLFVLLIIAGKLEGQNKEIERLMRNEFKMTFPSVYFKNNSTEYAAMPYSADSCYKYIAAHIENINSMVLWRDSTETKKLTRLRKKEIRKGLRKHVRARIIRIEAVGGQQKITSRTIYTGTDSSQIQYLLSLNSVFDVSGLLVQPRGKRTHLEKPRWWCRWCWARGVYKAKFRAWYKRNRVDFK